MEVEASLSNTSADLTVEVTPPPSFPFPVTSRRPPASLCVIPDDRLCECTEAEAEIVLQLKNELREKELKLTDIRLEALSSAHHLDQIREAMNRMQVRGATQSGSSKVRDDEP